MGNQRFTATHKEGNTFRPVALVSQSDRTLILQADFPGSGTVLNVSVFDMTSDDVPNAAVYTDTILVAAIGTHVFDTEQTGGLGASAGLPGGSYNFVGPIVPQVDGSANLILKGGRNYEYVVELVDADQDSESIYLVWEIHAVRGNYLTTT